MIKILIIDDDTFKRADISRFLGSLGMHGPALDTASNVSEALNKLRKIKYDIIILDLNLPLRNNDSAVQNGGYKILYSLNNDRYLTPTYIIGLTQYDEFQSEFVPAFKKYDINIYSYNNDEWKQIVTTRIKWLIRSSGISTIRTTGIKVLILTHGIMTLGKWTDKVELSFGDSDYKIIKYKYPHFSALKIIFPWSRKKALQDYADFVEDILIEHPDCELNFISHSFGTFMTMNSLYASDISYMPDIKNIILCGSVLHTDFEMSNFIKKLKPYLIINDCAYNDTALLLCNMTCYGLGNAGRIGFRGHNNVLINRYYRGGHSVFFDESRIEKYWKPIFLNKTIEKHDERNFSFIRETLESLVAMLSPFIKISLSISFLWLCYVVVNNLFT
ncbi:response regulator (plasmid) [Klebsiella variicola subsp. variicola]|uniref:response regulator n=1 Tax=Klebsiella variicola TaxID=244366 RepID=UPI001F06B34E|nr:response regulator [Klebsiella variicola]UML91840.1 response regulator [Klebsiella variicola subsp. variicola]